MNINRHLKSNHDFNKSNCGGLIEVNESEIANYKKRIDEFNSMISNRIPVQPSFFVSKKSWNLLANGQLESNIGENVNWIGTDYCNYEVFGFLFSIAFDTNFKRKDLPNEQFAYIKISTIIKNNQTEPSKISQLIIKDRIAYTNLYFGFGYGKSLRNDDLTFVDSDNIDLINLIDKNVLEKETLKSEITSINRNIPKNFLLSNNKNESDLISKNVGIIISKKKIWDDILELSDSNGTQITLGWDNINKMIIPQFTTNNDKDTRMFYGDLPCPGPGCGDNY